MLSTGDAPRRRGAGFKVRNERDVPADAKDRSGTAARASQASGADRGQLVFCLEVDALAVFGIQTFLSIVVFGLIGWWYAWPWLRSVEWATALTALTFIHALRPVGATVLVPSVAGTALPRDFAEAVAYGDLATSVLAILTVIALRVRLGFAIALVWLTNVVGALDLANALVGGVRYDIPHLGMGSFWYVVTILVPILWIAHFLAFVLLFRRREGHRVPTT